VELTMLLMEYIARDLLAAQGIAVPRGTVIESDADTSQATLSFPAVLKAQVPTGGRGKAGGIKIVNSVQETWETVGRLLGMTIKGLTVDRLLLVEKVTAVQEWYLAILLDRGAKVPMIIFSPEGGMEIEEIARLRPDRVVRGQVNPFIGIQEYITRYLLDRAALEPKYFEPLHTVLKQLYQVYWENDCLLAEINPLMVDHEGRLIAGDAKITIDDSALPVRHPNLLALRDSLEREKLVFEARKYGFLYVPIHSKGNITIMSNGSGMLMASLDTLQQRGFTANSVLDLGGGATADRIARGVELMMTQSGVHSLFVNIFGGITRCDEIAGGIKNAVSRLRDNQFIVVRMEGTNKPLGQEILRSIPAGRIAMVDKLSETVGVLAERMAAL
jgi:succinyl-CoA synthetase beta subunit